MITKSEIDVGVSIPVEKSDVADYYETDTIELCINDDCIIHNEMFILINGIKYHVNIDDVENALKNIKDYIARV